MLYGSTIRYRVCSLDYLLLIYGQGQVFIKCKNLSNCRVWSFPSYFIEPKFQKPAVKMPKWAPRIQIWFNMGFRKIHSEQFGLVLNLLTGLILPQYHVVFDGMFSTVMISTNSYPEVWIRLVKSRSSRIQVILYQ